MMMRSIRIKTPGTVANLVCGFDILGMALQEPFDELELKRTDQPGIVIHHKDDFGLPEDPLRNIAGVALQALVTERKVEGGFELHIKKNIRPGSGIGSSASSAMAPVFAANQLLDLNLNNEDMIRFAMEGEYVASGSRHADNLAPCLMGGLVLIRETEPLDLVPLDMPDLPVVVVHPQIEVKTAFARSILPKEVPLSQAVRQWANVAGMVTGFLKRDIPLLKRSMQDHIVEPVRSRLIPGYKEVMERCREAGLIGGGISGSGPSMFMFAEDEKGSAAAAAIIREVYDCLGIEYRVYITEINKRGAEAF
jgi:homoserine kinase